METEKQLIEEFQQGERMAGRRLYERYGGRLMAICMRYMANGEEARDVLQDAFVKILTSIGRFEYRGEGSLQAWMSKITVNEALGHLGQQGMLRIADELPADMADDDEPPERIPPDVLTRMISELPAGYRTVLNLFVFEQVPHKEIARRLGITESTSGSQYNRAKKILAQKIKKYIKQGYQ